MLTRGLLATRTSSASVQAAPFAFSAPILRQQSCPVPHLPNLRQLPLPEGPRCRRRHGPHQRLQTLLNPCSRDHHAQAHLHSGKDSGLALSWVSSSLLSTCSTSPYTFWWTNPP